MYLSEEKRAQIRTCIEIRLSPSKKSGNSSDKNKSQLAKKTGANREPLRKVSQILFEARSGNEVFTPF